MDYKIYLCINLFLLLAGLAITASSIYFILKNKKSNKIKNKKNNLFSFYHVVFILTFVMSINYGMECYSITKAISGDLLKYEGNVKDIRNITEGNDKYHIVLFSNSEGEELKLKLYSLEVYNNKVKEGYTYKVSYFNENITKNIVLVKK